jgi:membrane protease YdiL (CAAX protease family)
VFQRVRASPKARSVAYLGIAAGAAEIVNQLVYDPEDPWSNIHYPLFPITAALTYAFASQEPRDRDAWRRSPTRRDVGELGSGVVLGATAISGFLGIARLLRWVSAPLWGWETSSASEVVRAVGSHAVLNASAVWNEEMVFHGYGFDLLRRAFGLYWACLISTVLFAVYHGLGVRRVLALSLLGAVFLLLRLETESLWLPVGFHWAWNMVQDAVVGNPDVAPSIRPLLVHGPEAWVGRPGAVQPGWLVVLYLAALFGFLLWRRARRATPQAFRNDA